MHLFHILGYNLYSWNSTKFWHLNQNQKINILESETGTNDKRLSFIKQPNIAALSQYSCPIQTELKSQFRY